MRRASKLAPGPGAWRAPADRERAARRRMGRCLALPRRLPLRPRPMPSDGKKAQHFGAELASPH
jgi:hypothetical protein